MKQVRKIDIDITDIELFADDYISDLRAKGHSREEQFAVKDFVMKFLERKGINV